MTTSRNPSTTYQFLTETPQFELMATEDQRHFDEMKKVVDSTTSDLDLEEALQRRGS